MQIIIRNNNTLLIDEFKFKCVLGKKGSTSKKIEGDKKLNNKIERNLQKKVSNSNSNKIFKLKIITNKERKITSKDSSGNPESFRLTINLFQEILLYKFL